MANKGLYLKTNEFLTVGDYLVSGNGRFFAVMQSDGNFCVYRGTGPGDNRGALWCSMEHPGEGQYFATIQSDGNFCVYQGANPKDRKDAVWCSMKHPGEGQYFAIIQDDGNFCIYKGTGLEDMGDAVWCSAHVDPIAKVGMNKFEDRFKALHFYAQKNDFNGAFPTFMEEPSDEGKVYGALLLNEKAEFCNIPANELGNPKTPEERFKALHFYAQKKDFGGAFPTFADEGSGQDKLYGVLLLKKEAAEFRNIPANELGNPKTPEERFKALHSYAQKKDFGGAFPTFTEEGSGQDKTYGALLIKKDYAVFRKILFYDLLKLLIRPGDIIYGSQKGRFPDHIAIIVRDKNKKGKDDLMVRESYDHVPGVSNISLKDFCECGDYHNVTKQGVDKTISDYLEHYDYLRISRAKCNDAVAQKAAENAKKASGEYDLSYFYVAGFVGALTIGALAPRTLPYTIAAAIAFAKKVRDNWNNKNKWYCSKLVYLAYHQAGFDLYPKKEGKCLNPFSIRPKKDNIYPYLYDKKFKALFDGKCPWTFIAPRQVLKSQRVDEIWSWKKQ